jgi:STAS domain
MLRVEIHDSPNTLSLKLEGRFTGDDAENTRTLITRCREDVRLVVDLTDVTFIDSVGEEVLSFFGRFGAEFAASTSYALDVCERLHLRLAHAGDTSGASPTNGHRRRAHVQQSKNEEV